jgi:hypothetical protein
LRFVWLGLSFVEPPPAWFLATAMTKEAKKETKITGISLKTKTAADSYPLSQRGCLRHRSLTTGGTGEALAPTLQIYRPILAHS